jgi:heterodisulfide reductase subunit A-like polyferredoxin
MLDKAHTLAVTDPDRCIGCRKCMEVCQFGAIFYSAGRKKAGIDLKKCYGCGICRSVCTKEAISLHKRAA